MVRVGLGNHRRHRSPLRLIAIRFPDTTRVARGREKSIVSFPQSSGRLTDEASTYALVMHRARRTYCGGLLALAMLIAGCTTAAEVELSDRVTPQVSAEAGDPENDEEGPTPTVVPDSPEPTEPPIEPAPSPTAEPIDFSAELVLAMSPDARFGYVATHAYWNDPVDCDGPPREALARIDLRVDDPSDVSATAAGLVENVDVEQMIFSPGGRAAVVVSCGGGDTNSSLHVVEFDEAGRVLDLGPAIHVEDDPNEDTPYLIQWDDEESIRFQLYVQEDPADPESAFFEERVISAIDGTVLSSGPSPFEDEGAGFTRPAVPTPDGSFTYREVADPSGLLGCEGFDVAATIEVDDGSGPRPAFRDSSQVFSNVADLHFGPDGLIAWTSNCEGFTTAHVGRIDDDGSILDAHFVDTYSLQSDDGFVDYYAFRLSDDGFIVGLGLRFRDDGESELALIRYDLATDPQFVVTADPPVRINTDIPLAATMSGEGFWYTGESRGTEPACGAQTLYGDTAGGPVRAFGTDFELDAIADFDVSDTRTVEFDDGYSYVTRVVVVSTECPDEYGGRRLWFGSEPERVRYGLYLERADAPEVAEVLSVREVAVDDGFGHDVLATVVMLDGSITEIALTPAQ